MVARSTSTPSVEQSIPKIADDMLQMLREAGFPPMIVGAMRHGMKGITEEKVREICLRVAIGMANIYAGGNVRESLNPDTLLDDDAMARMVDIIRSANKDNRQTVGMLADSDFIPAVATSS
jgi:hypothetical protein